MSGEATIRRGVRNARYAAIPNHVFEDDRLSMEARWLLGYLLSKPDNWTVVIGDITKRGNCGRDKARKMIAELIDIGYAEREQRRDDGKFGSSAYVIHDEPLNRENIEISVETESVASLPQTEMPSPVKPSPDSPSPVKSAHSNNSSLPNTDDSQERDAREAAFEGEEDPKAMMRAFKRWYGDWPTRKVDSQYAAERAWQALTAEQRAECIAKSPTYIERVNAVKGLKVPFAGVYLKGRDWEKLDDPKSDVALPVVHGPFTRPWHAVRLFKLSKPMATAMPAPTAMQRTLLAQGGEAAERVRLERQQRYGWPDVSSMDERAGERKGVTVPPDLLRISETFGKVRVGGLVEAAWKRLHDRRGWPWLPLPQGVEWLWLPAIAEDTGELDEAVERAIGEFERALANSHDTGKEAAE